MRKNLLTGTLLIIILIFSQLSFAAQSKARPESIDVAFVLDRSVSMSGDPINTAANAIAQAIQLMQLNDEVGLACYSHESEIVYPMTRLIDEDTMADAINSMSTIEIYGMTSIALGLQEGQTVLNQVDTLNTPQAMVLMSDGIQNHVPFVSTVLPSIPEITDVYTIGFGSNCDEYVLNLIANQTGAFYRYCDGGNIAEVTEEIMQEIRDRGMVAKFGDNFSSSDDTFVFDFVIDEMNSDMIVNLIWQNEETDLNLQILDPNGNIVEVIENEVKLNEFDTQTYYTIANPVSGIWSAKVTGNELSVDSEQFFMHVSVKSELKLDVSFSSGDFHADEPLGIVANLYNALETVENATVVANIIDPDFNEFEVALFDDGLHNDGEANDGIFATEIPEAIQGTYTVNYIATDADESFTRLAARSTYVNSASQTNTNESELPGVEVLELSNYPNPFNPTTNINFNLSVASQVRIEIYNLNGQIIDTVADDYFGAGYNNVSWDGIDGEGRPVASGVYFYKMKAGRYTSTKKMILMK